MLAFVATTARRTSEWLRIEMYAIRKVHLCLDIFRVCVCAMYMLYCVQSFVALRKVMRFIIQCITLISVCSDREEGSLKSQTCIDFIMKLTWPEHEHRCWRSTDEASGNYMHIWKFVLRHVCVFGWVFGAACHIYYLSEKCHFLCVVDTAKTFPFSRNEKSTKIGELTQLFPKLNSFINFINRNFIVENFKVRHYCSANTNYMHIRWFFNKKRNHYQRQIYQSKFSL